MDDKYYTLAEIANLLKVSTKTVRREIERGHLAACMVAACWRVSASQLAEYLAREAAK